MLNQRSTGESYVLERIVSQGFRVRAQASLGGLQRVPVLSGLSRFFYIYNVFPYTHLHRL